MLVGGITFGEVITQDSTIEQYLHIMLFLLKGLFWMVRERGIGTFSAFLCDEYTVVKLQEVHTSLNTQHF